MKEQLIDFETAKLAKAKGFNQIVGIGVKYNLGQYYNHKGELNGAFSIEHLRSIVNKEEANSEPIVAAPTQSLLQKWLREVHSIIVSVDIGDDRTYFISLTVISHNSNGDNIWGNYKTYEEALDNGLQEALEQIPEK